MELLSAVLSGAYSLDDLIRWGGYAVLFLIVFTETGLLIGFFLPGDSLLITAGVVAAAGGLNIWWLNVLLIVAAITGDSVGYAIGVRLGPRVAEAISLALHELTTNALKYGALANDAGELAISWSKFDGSVAIDWAETGAPEPVRARREGFGRELIERGLPFQLGAHTSLEFKPSGVHCRITAKVSDSAIGRPA